MTDTDRIREALGRIARQASIWPRHEISESEIVAAVTDASQSLDALVARLEAAEAVARLSKERALLILRICRDHHRTPIARLTEIEHEAEHFVFTALAAWERSQETGQP